MPMENRQPEIPESRSRMPNIFMPSLETAYSSFDDRDVTEAERFDQGFDDFNVANGLVSSGARRSGHECVSLTGQFAARRYKVASLMGICTLL